MGDWQGRHDLAPIRSRSAQTPCLAGRPAPATRGVEGEARRHKAQTVRRGAGARWPAPRGWTVSAAAWATADRIVRVEQQVVAAPCGGRPTACVSSDSGQGQRCAALRLICSLPSPPIARHGSRDPSPAPGRLCDQLGADGATCEMPCLEVASHPGQALGLASNNKQPMPCRSASSPLVTGRRLVRGGYRVLNGNSSPVL